MSDLKKEYKQLTNVDIEEQKRIWDERGKGYYGEYLVLQELRRRVDGKSKILMNLNIPVDAEKTTEIDLALIHETGIYLFEMKHYKGIIYGDADRENWTQYFKTTENQSFKNPIYQNEYHRQAMHKLYPDLPIYSYVVFTNEDVVLKVSSPAGRSAVLTTLAGLKYELNTDFGSRAHLLSGEKIENIFKKLSAYSPRIKNEEADEDVKALPISAYMGLQRRPVVANAATAPNSKRSVPLREFVLVSLMCIVIVVALFATGFGAVEKQKEMQETIEQLEQEMHSALPIDVTQQIKVSNVRLRSASDTSASTFSAYLGTTGNTYGFILNEDSQYYIVLWNGDVKVVDMFGDRLPYNADANKLSPKGSGGVTGGQLSAVTLSGVAEEDVLEIYISNVTLWRNYNGKEYYYHGNSLRVY